MQHRQTHVQVQQLHPDADGEQPSIIFPAQTLHALPVAA